MTIDPRDYDLGELRDVANRENLDPHDLRELADSNGDAPEWGPFERRGERRGERGGANRAENGGTATGSNTSLGRSDRYRSLLMLQSAADDDVSKPYLDGVPASPAAETAVFEWLEFLVNRGGFRGAMEALRYYHNVNWLTEDAVHELEAYLFGFSDAESDRYGELAADDHRESLLFIAELNALD